MKKSIRVVIMGAAGRDFHNFNTCFRNNRGFEVVCFTAEQIPDIAGRRYPPELSGRLYPRGIPIHPETDLPEIISKKKIDMVVLAYSDLPHMEVMHKASLVNALGPDFVLMGTRDTMLKSSKPVIAVTAVRTGAGKSQTTREISRILKSLGKKVVVVRHPMPYGDLSKQICQRYEKYEDLDKYDCTIEEREEYEPLIEESHLLFAGVDYQRILKEAEKEADVIIWDGGNNDTPFFKPDLHIVMADPHRPGHELSFYPGETNIRMADIIIINKERTAPKRNIKTVKENIKKTNPDALVVDAASVISVSNPSLIRKRRVLVVEDGPTLTHGGMAYGAGTIAARRFSARLVDPRPYASGSIKKLFEKYPHLGKVLPAMGYSEKQLGELEKTINRAKCDAVIIGTPIRLSRLIRINKPVARIRYTLEEISRPDLDQIIKRFLKSFKTTSQR
jgi:predicted GTPase